MIAAFFHDAPLYQDQKDGKVYSVGFPYSLWQRYLEIFERIVVSTRHRDFGRLDEKGRRGLKLSSGENVEFSLLPGYKSPSQILTSKNTIKAVLKRVDCAIIRLPSTVGLMACYEALKMGKPFLIEVVGCAWDAFWQYGNLAGKLFAPIMFYLNKKSIQKAPYVLYITREFLQRRYPSRGVAGVCSDVEISMVDNHVLNQRLDRISQMEGRPIVFGLIGSLNVGYKGQDVAMRALAQLREQLDFRLRLLGGGNKERWQELAGKLGIADKVEFCGMLQGGAPVFEWMDNLDIYLIPSRAEAQGRALIEAMSRGCPVLGASTGGIVELIDPSCIHTAGDFTHLANQIRQMVRDQEWMRECAITNFQEAKMYSSETLNNQRREFLEYFAQYVSNIVKIK